MHEEDATSAQTQDFSALERPHVVAMWPGGSVVKELAPGAKITVGRSARCDIHVDHPSVSREHAAFYGGPPLAVEDLGSTNGSTVAGAKIPSHAKVTLERGQIVAIGAAILVVNGPQESAAVHQRREGGTPRARAAGIIVEDDAIKEIHRVVDLVAKGDLSVILLGETGVGKEVIADAIQRRSPRAGAAYIRVNCAALPEALLESELFGYERGAFTGALQTKPGLLETAHGGTVFLDEIGEMPVSMQAKLLSVLENREVTRVGGLKARTIDVRFIAATNRDLTGKGSTFRQDLYFRLNGISITIPPLRSRRREIAPLAREFVAVACRDAKRDVLSIDPEAMEVLERHEWPGNVRELRNVMHRAVTLCDRASIGVDHLPPELGTRAGDAEGDRTTMIAPPQSVPAPGSGTSVPEERRSLRDVARDAVESVERERIAEAMARCAGNQTRAAKILGISRRTLVTRLDEYGFSRPLKDREP